MYKLCRKLCLYGAKHHHKLYCRSQLPYRLLDLTFGKRDVFSPFRKKEKKEEEKSVTYVQSGIPFRGRGCMKFSSFVYKLVFALGFSSNNLIIKRDWIVRSKPPWRPICLGSSVLLVLMNLRLDKWDCSMEVNDNCITAKTLWVVFKWHNTIFHLH